jgi:uncharacterized protein (DUF433 family)
MAIGKKVLNSIQEITDHEQGLKSGVRVSTITADEDIDIRLMRMAGFDRITIEPQVMGGQPCIRSMRLTVRRVVESLAIHPDWDRLRAEYPELEPDDIRQALEFAASNLDDRVIPVESA